MSESYDDPTLVSECTTGNRAAWEIFVKRFSKLIYYSINTTLKSHGSYLQEEDLADIHNSIFLSFLENNYKKLRQFEGRRGCTLSSWVRLISIRYTIDFLRSHREHISLDEEREEIGTLGDTIPDPQISAEEEMESKESELVIKEAIDELSSTDKLFIKLYYEKELPPEEIAEIMNISVNAIYSKKNRIREKIRKILEEKGFIARNSG